MPLPELKATLTDIGTEELNHLEMIGAIVYQLTKDLTEDEIKKQGFEDYFVDHTTGVYPQSAGGSPFTAASMQVKGDPITDLHENMAAEQKARSTYDNILRFCDDYDVKDAIRFLREREVVHYQRFGENLRLMTDKLDEKNFYAFNPSFDKKFTTAYAVVTIMVERVSSRMNTPPFRYFRPQKLPQYHQAGYCRCSKASYLR